MYKESGESKFHSCTKKCLAGHHALLNRLVDQLIKLKSLNANSNSAEETLQTRLPVVAVSPGTQFDPLARETDLRPRALTAPRFNLSAI